MRKFDTDHNYFENIISASVKKADVKNLFENKEEYTSYLLETEDEKKVQFFTNKKLNGYLRIATGYNKFFLAYITESSKEIKKGYKVIIDSDLRRIVNLNK